MSTRNKYRKIFILAEKDHMVEDMDAFYLEAYIKDGCATYPTAWEAERGRKNGHAYDDPDETKVVGFEIKPFVPEKRKSKRRKANASE